MLTKVLITRVLCCVQPYCHDAPRASVYHGLAYFGDFRLQTNYNDYDDDDGIGMVIMMGSGSAGIACGAIVAIPRERHYVKNLH